MVTPHISRVVTCTFAVAEGGSRLARQMMVLFWNAAVACSPVKQENQIMHEARMPDVQFHSSSDYFRCQPGSQKAM